MRLILKRLVICICISGTTIFSLLKATESHSKPIEPPLTDEDLSHWAFQPVRRPELPKVQNEDQVRNPIDRFVLEKLESMGLKLMPPADRNTLIRRLSFDIRGLPPTPKEVKAFTEDESEGAYRDLIDRFLASSAYGERWGQHWLDVVRFAETDGFEHDKARPEAWRYRDWVIRSLNEDMPYDEFVRMQIAGDELYPKDEDKANATGFLVAGPDMPDINLAEERAHTVLNEMTSTTSLAFMGLTMGCAQCHDHKSDPVSQADFYRLRAVFANMDFPEKNKQLKHYFEETDADAPPSFIMVRGDFRNPGPGIEPAFIRAANPMGMTVDSQGGSGDAGTSGRRKALAAWLTDQDHPLTARVMMNRLWKDHFGRAIVGTPNDFGVLGDRPSHGKLLDWLSAELVSSGWSLKEMHRLLLQSATYQQVSRPVDDSWEVAIRKDPGNRLLSRMNRKRLEGEAIRDAMLSVSGRLNPKKGGPGVHAPLPPEVSITLLEKHRRVDENESEHYRRSIYLFTRRNLRYPLFDVFDRPDANVSCGRRNVSTTAPQSLTLLNSEFSLQSARYLAGVILNSSTINIGDWVHECYARVLSRSASKEEWEIGTTFLKEQALLLENENREASELALPLETSVDFDPYQGSALTDFCLAMFNLNEMIYLD